MARSIAQLIDACKCVGSTILNVTIEDLALVRQRGSCCRLDLAIDMERATSLAETFRLLADPTRLSMLATLRRASVPVCICDFTATYNLSQSTISHHMGRLKASGLVESDRQGIWIYYRISDDIPALVQRLLDSVLN